MDPELKAAERLCIETAAHHNHTALQARNCEEFSVGCPTCPFRILDNRTLQLHINARIKGPRSHASTAHPIQ